MGSELKYLTALDDNYETCERTKACLRIHCGDRSPHIFSKILGLGPTKIIEVGVRSHHSLSPDAPIGQVNLWILDSESTVQSKDLRAHLEWLLDKVEPSSQQILQLREEGLLMDISCVWWSKFGEGGPTLWPTHMRRIAQLDLELSIAFAFYAETWPSLLRAVLLGGPDRVWGRGCASAPPLVLHRREQSHTASHWAE